MSRFRPKNPGDVGEEISSQRLCVFPMHWSKFGAEEFWNPQLRPNHPEEAQQERHDESQVAQLAWTTAGQKRKVPTMLHIELEDDFENFRMVFMNSISKSWSRFTGRLWKTKVYGRSRNLRWRPFFRWAFCVAQFLCNRSDVEWSWEWFLRFHVVFFLWGGGEVR